MALLSSGSLAFALLVLRLPRPAANQIPVSALVVMAALAAGEQSYAGERALDTVLGAAVGVGVSLALPASRCNDARESMRRLATVIGDELDAMGEGLCATWSTSQTAEWRHTARLTRQRHGRADDGGRRQRTRAPRSGTSVTGRTSPSSACTRT